MSTRVHSALRLARWAALAGGSAVTLLALVWRGILPGGAALREIVNRARYRDRAAAFEQDAASVPPGSVVFLGSSTISGFPLGREYPGAPAVNRGISGETALGLLRRLDRSLPVARPAGCVIYTGANDVRPHAIPPPEIVSRVRRVLDAIEARFPGVPVALVELMPHSDDGPEALARLHASNDGLRALAAERGATFVRTSRPPITAPDGLLSPAMTDDGVHLNAAGYTVLSRWILEEGGAAVAPLAGRADTD